MLRLLISSTAFFRKKKLLLWGLIIHLMLLNAEVKAQQTAYFTTPDTVCLNAPVNITNYPTTVTNSFWNFCTANLNTAPTGTNLGNLGGHFSAPVFMDYVEDNGKYYGFVVNFNPGGLTRLDFGNNLLNTPTPTFLGNVGGLMNNINGSEGIQVVKNEGKWYAFIVGGAVSAGSIPKLVKIEFGTSISNNSPTATAYKNLGGMSQSIDLHIFQDSANWYGFAVNSDNNTITRIDFTNSFNNTPTAINLGNIGGLAYPTGIYVTKNKGNWFAFITNTGTGIPNSTNSFITKLEFGNSLLNTPTGTNIGNPNGVLSSPRDITIINQCGDYYGFAVNFSNANDIIRFNLDNNLQTISNSTSLGNIGNLSFPHSISKLFRIGADLYSFVTNVSNNTLTRLKFSGCNNANIPNANSINPPTIKYNAAGTYHINLTIDDGLPTQSSYCKEVVVVTPPALDFSFEQVACNPKLIQFKNLTTPLTNYEWSFGDGTFSKDSSPTKLYSTLKNYTVSLSNTDACRDTVYQTIPVNISQDSIITTHDTSICKGNRLQIKTKPSLNYCWSPTKSLSNPNAQNPIAFPNTTTVYYVNAQLNGKNLIKNGDFSLGDTLFYSNYTSTSNGYVEGTYSVDTNAIIWHNNVAQCNDHTNDIARKQMLVNGASIANVIIWQDTIKNIQPNTSYVFSAWLQSLYKGNPALLQFSINVKSIGDTFRAPLDTCTWNRYLITWNAGNATSAIISIINKNIGLLGNDFALDDIEFYEVTLKQDSVIVRVNENLLPKQIKDTTICFGNQLKLIALPAATYTWTYSTYMSLISDSLAVIDNLDTTQSFYVNRSNTIGCTVSDTFNVRVQKAKPFLNFSFEQEVCNPLFIHFYNQSDSNNAFQWSVNNIPFSSNDLPSLLVNTPNTYKITLQTTEGCVDSITKNILNNTLIDSLIDKRNNTICANASIALNASPALEYCWQPSVGLSDSTIASPTLSLPNIGTHLYHLKAKTIVNNLIINGDFSQGNSNFSSDYKYNPTNGKPNGVYNIGKNPSLPIGNPWHPSFSHCNDHTTGNGNMMMINGSSIPNEAVWKQQAIKVKTNTNYAFSTWVQSLTHTNPAQLIFAINNHPIGSIFTAEGQTCKWKQFFSIWNSGKDSLITIAILNKNTLISGNDFALDDIQFGEIVIKEDSISITTTLSPLVRIINKDSAICINDSFQLQAVGTTQFEWQTNSYLSNSNSSNPIAKPLQDTSFIVKGFNSKDCFGLDTIHIKVNTLPTLSISPVKTICKNDSIALQAQTNTVVAYHWNLDTTLSNLLIANPIAKPLDTTRYFLSIKDTNGCKSFDSITVNVAPLPFVKSIGDTTLCVGSTIQLQTQTSSNQISWSPTIGLSDSNSANPIDTVFFPKTQFIVTAQSPIGCIAKDTVIIKGLPTPTVLLNQHSVAICTSQSTPISVKQVPNAIYFWSPNLAINNVKIPNPTVNPTATQTYHIRISNSNNCFADDSVLVKVAPLPNFSVSPNTATICEGDSILITASGGNTYSWSQNSHVLYPNSNSNWLAPKITTNYTIRLADTLCKVASTIPVKITVNKAPTITLKKSNDIDCIKTSATLSATGAASYQWSPINNLTNYTSANATATPFTTTPYYVLATDLQGCTTIASIIVNVNTGSIENGFAMPNAFVPNGNNNCFGIKKWGYVFNLSFSIYNRLGQRIFHTNNPTDCWNGTVNNTLQDAGTYIFDITANTLCGSVHRKGTFVLIK